ncbi:VWA domain-containing protein [bacterium]|nr:VWA domain-containing protein [bacterium]
MDDIFSQFFRFLEQYGYTVPISQKIVFFQSIQQINILNKDIFFSLCRTTLASDYSQLLKLNSYLDIYFNEKNIITENFKNHNFLSKLIDNRDDKENKNLFETEATPIESVVSRYMFKSKNYGGLLKYVVLNEREQLMRLIHLSAQNIDYNQLKTDFGAGKITDIIRKRLGTDKLPELFEKFLDSLKKSGASDDEIEHISKRVKIGLQTVKKSIRDYVKLRVDFEKESKNNNQIKENSIYDKNINSINYKESSEDMSEALTQLIDKLKRKKGIREKKDRKGSLDIKKTIKKSIQTELIPFKVYFKKRVLKKNSIIFFCDISESVQKTTFFMLKFILSLRERFDKMRAFVFISEAGEITDYFENSSINDAISKIVSSPPIDTNINSNYETAFESFIKKFEHYLTPSTLLFIVGDGRGNYDSNALSSIIYLKKKVKKITWLNPESPDFWGLSDSDMNLYLEHIDSAYPLYNLKTLERFASDFNLF